MPVVEPDWPELFDVPGCPACRYVAAADDSYLAAVALDGHRDPGLLQRLTASRGMCGAHTRRLLAEPGAAVRLAGVYHQVIAAALGDVTAQPATCPACDHASAAADRLVGYLLGEATRGDRRTYKRHGGLCLPHLRRAAARRGADTLWLVRFMVLRLTAPSPAMGLLAGLDSLAVHAGAAREPAGPLPSPGGTPPNCVACQARADAERSAPEAGAAECLCAQHLRDAVNSAGGAAADLLTRQSSLYAARLARVVDGRSRNLGSYLSVRALRALADPDCPVCRCAEAACRRAINTVAGSLRQGTCGSSGQPSVCVRHARDVHAVDRDADRRIDALLGARGRQLLGQLTAAAGGGAGDLMAGRADGEIAAVRDAALFLDGSVFAAGPAAVPAVRGTDAEVRLRCTQRRRGSP